jgi:hypothetical protein
MLTLGVIHKDCPFFIKSSAYEFISSIPDKLVQTQSGNVLFSDSHYTEILTSHPRSLFSPKTFQYFLYGVFL